MIPARSSITTAACQIPQARKRCHRDLLNIHGPTGSIATDIRDDVFSIRLLRGKLKEINSARPYKKPEYV